MMNMWTNIPQTRGQRTAAGAAAQEAQPAAAQRGGSQARERHLPMYVWMFGHRLNNNTSIIQKLVCFGFHASISTYCCSTLVAKPLLLC